MPGSYGRIARSDPLRLAVTAQPRLGPATSRARAISTWRYPLTRLLLAIGVLALVSGAFAIVPSPSPSRATDAHVVELAQARAETAGLRRQLAAERRTHKLTVARTRATRAAPSVDHALTIAAAAYGVDKAKLRRVATCESTLDPSATNGPYVGLFQFGTSLWHASPYGRFSRTDPYAASLAAAWAFSRGKAGQWPVCGGR